MASKALLLLGLLLIAMIIDSSALLSESKGLEKESDVEEFDIEPDSQFVVEEQFPGPFRPPPHRPPRCRRLCCRRQYFRRVCFCCSYMNDKASKGNRP
ncbi:uncharacterized protein LOC144708520 isoform X2 [Wolffia australiana]